MTGWYLYVRCQSCRTGHRFDTGMKRSVPIDDAVFIPVICAGCGSTKFDDPRPGRKVSAAVWWNPLTWLRVRWEWRDDCVRVLPGGDANAKETP